MLTINKLSHSSSYNMDAFSSFKDFLQKIFELGKYCPYSTLYRAITSTYMVNILHEMIKILNKKMFDTMNICIVESSCAYNKGFSHIIFLFVL